MKIPAKYQVFDSPVILTDQDEQRLSGLLSGWPTLSGIIAGTCEPDVQRMIIMEMLGKKRMPMLHRLIGRLSTIRRQRIYQRIAKAIK